MEENKKVEEVTVEPVTEAEVQAFNNEDVVETKEVVSFPELEKHKNDFAKAYRISRVISYLSSAIVIAIIIVAYTVVFPIPDVGTWAGVIMIIITLVISVVFSKIHRNSLTKRIKKYMADYNEEVNQVAFKESKVTNSVFDFGGTIDKQEFINAKLLKDIIDTNSRNLLKYHVGNYDVEIADFVAYRQDGKRAKSVFLGKFVNGTTTEAMEGRVLLYLKPDPNIFKDAAGPDDLEELELMEDKPRYRLYATSKDARKKLSLKALNALLKINPDQELADITVSLYANKVAITLTYSDALMVVPYKEPIPNEAILKYKEHITEVNNFLSLL